MSSPTTNDSSLPTDQAEQPSETVSKADFDKLSGNYHAAQRQIQKLQSSQVNPDSLIQDTDFVKRVFETHSVPFNEEGKFQIPEQYKDAQAMEETFKERLSNERRKWESKELKPFQEKLSTYEQQLESVRLTNLRSQLEHAARRSGIVDGKFKPLPFGKAANYAPVHAAESEFKLSDGGEYVLFDGDQPVYTQTGDNVTPDKYWDFFKQKIDDDTRLEWFGNPAQRGSNFQNNGKPGGSFVMTRDEARKDPGKYRAMDKLAREKGQKVTLVD